MKKILFLFLTLSHFEISYAQKVKEYVVISKLEVYDTLEKKFYQSEFFENSTILCYKNYAIRNLVRIRIHESDDRGSKREVIPLKYFLIDLKERKIYDYSHFSKSAKYLGSYHVSDSMNENAFGYFFWGNKDSSKQMIIPKVKKNPMPDTLIKNILFKREYFFNTKIINNDTLKSLWILYYRYDIKNSIFHFDVEFDKTNKLPLCRFEIFENKIQHAMEYSYERLKLTRKERQVFKAWIRNAKKQQSLENGHVP